MPDKTQDAITLTRGLTHQWMPESAQKPTDVRMDVPLVMTREEWERIEEWRKTHPPIMGGAPEGDDAPDDADDSGGGTATEERPDTAATGGDILRTDATEEEDDDTPQPGTVEAQLAVERRERQRLQRENAAMQKAKRRDELEAKRKADEHKAEQGQWKELAQEREREVESLKAQIAERDQRDQQREMRGRVEEVAERLNFRRPRRAYPLLVDELSKEEAEETLSDPTLIEAALKRMIRDDASLVDQQRRSGAPVGRNGQPAPTPQQGLTETLLNLTGGRTR